MKKIFTRFPIGSYYLLAIICTIILGGFQSTLFPDSFATGFMLPQWGPGIAAIIATLFLKGKRGLQELFSNLSIKKSILKYSIIAAVIPLLICMLSYGVFSFIKYGEWVPPVLYRSLPSYLICLMATLFSVTGEEIGWRGFMLPKMMGKHSIFMSGLIVGILWGVWHFRFESISLAVLFIISVIWFSFISTWLYIKTNKNLIASIIFHTIINMCSTVLFEKLILIANAAASLKMNALLYGIYAVLFAIPAIYLMIRLMTWKRSLS